MKVANDAEICILFAGTQQLHNNYMHTDARTHTHTDTHTCEMPYKAFNEIPVKTHIKITKA